MLVHVEIQAGHETDFAERMFIYYYRLFDRYRLPLTSLVVLADDRPKWRPDHYERRLWGCELTLRFPVVKLLDYQGRLTELEADPNPFALATAAHLLAQATRQDPQQRLAGKLALTRRLYQRGWIKQEVLDLYEFIDWLLALPEALENAFLDEIHGLEESTNMRYISSAERIGMRRGHEQGMQQGIALTLRWQLHQRFGNPPPWVETRLQEGTPLEFERWAKRLLDADTLEAVFRE
ncbi:MAG TPA: cytosolic protein [Candidatus Competibacteraceae bacterium]|nr:cytosolic protein [Candidatus Competibacteraceae bacterium]HRZ07995.1 cytosolic protein [Candidatus Competibacteraceae bacterium]